MVLPGSSVTSDELVATHQRRRRDVDGLRGVAVLAVVAYHFFPTLAPAGLVGVDVFFVISGFVITSLLLRQQPLGWHGLASFWGHRIRRILPALAVVLLVVLVVGWWILWPPAYVLLGSSATWSAAMLGNVFMWSQTGYFVPEPTAYPLLNLWSLGVEEQFYLAWPLLLGLIVWLVKARIRGTAGVTVVLALLSWAACIWWVAIAPQPSVAESAVFYLPWFRAWELLAGALVAMLLFGGWGERWRGWASAAPRWVLWAVSALVVVSCLWGPDSANPAIYALPVVILTSVAIWLGSGEGRADASPFSIRPLLFFGAISYSLYLWHWPVLSFAYAMGATALAWISIALGLSILLAWLTRRYVEMPILRRPVSLRLCVAIVLCLGLVGALGLVVTKGRGFPARATGVAGQLSSFAYDESADYREGECFSTTSQPVRGEWPAACLTTASGTRAVLLWGDSLGASMYYGLQAALGDSATVSQVTAGACPPVTSAADRSDDCAFAHASAKAALAQQQWDTVVLAADWTEDLAREIPQTIAHIIETTGLPASQVVVVGPPPEWSPSLPGAWPFVVAQGLTQLPQYSDRGLVEGRDALDEEVRTAVESSGATYVSALDAMCTQDGCLVRTGPDASTLTAWDLYHLTRAGSTFLGSRIAAAMPGSP